jgi:hypothetical protein
VGGSGTPEPAISTGLIRSYLVLSVQLGDDARVDDHLPDVDRHGVSGQDLRRSEPSARFDLGEALARILIASPGRLAAGLRCRRCLHASHRPVRRVLGRGFGDAQGRCRGDRPLVRQNAPPSKRGWRVLRSRSFQVVDDLVKLFPEFPKPHQRHARLELRGHSHHASRYAGPDLREQALID